MKHAKQKFNLVLSFVIAFLLVPALAVAQKKEVVEPGSFETLKTPIILVVALVVAIGLLFLIEKLVPRKVRPIFSVVFLAASVFFGYKTYTSIMAPVEFKQKKVKRYTAVINKLKDIRDAQNAHKTVTGKYAPTFDSLERFIENAKFAIIERRDSSYTEFDKVYKIDKLKEVVIIDTLDFRPVKDSLFKDSDRYKTMKYVPYAKEENTTFKMEIGSKEVNDNYSAPVFKVSVPKEVVLHDLDKDLLDQEKKVVSVDEIDGPVIYVGSLDKVSDTGNWPTSYEIGSGNKKKK
ncbi:hypothetical protein C8N46_10383 [Kordia periserrulae]|uniref:Uncharacterized protein n=1 Tax=Kordia periserrulae TaxID=701523 RepID=A0A2T6C0Z8_9FLAO|nr:hypothetical protein [Kordia periserrulae]PTX61986.1 hypothetical protein C8N46_10383 [Kordia periserrulae]